MTTAPAPELKEEPATWHGLIVTVAGAVIAVGGIVAAVASAVLLFRTDSDWQQLLLGGVILLGVLLAERFTRDDRRVWQTIRTANYERDELLLALDDAEKEIAILRTQLESAQRPIVIQRRATDAKVAPHVHSAAWQDAVNMLKVTGDRDYLPGRQASGLSQEAQAAAVAELIEAKCVAREGTKVRLTCTVAEALAALNALDTVGG